MNEMKSSIRKAHCLIGEQIVLTLLQVFSLLPVSIDDA